MEEAENGHTDRNPTTGQPRVPSATALGDTKAPPALTQAHYDAQSDDQTQLVITEIQETKAQVGLGNAISGRILDKVTEIQRDGIQTTADRKELEKERKALPEKQRAHYGSAAYVTVQPFLLGDKPWSIAQSYIQLAIIKKEKKAEEKKAVTRDQLIESYETIYASKKNIALKDIPDLFKKNRKLLLIGRAGIGKTTVCKKLAHMWAKGEWGYDFEAVYVLPIRVLNNYDRRDDLEEIMARECFGAGCNRTEAQKRQDYIEGQLKERGEKVLLILDGLDEANASAKELLKQLKNEKYSHTAQLCVSRPYGVNAEDRKGAIEIENIGFNSDQVTKYAEEYFRVEGGQGEVKQSVAASGLLAYLQQHPDVRGTAHVPINLQILCNLWKEDGGRAVKKAGGSLTKLYDKMAEKIWERYEHECDKGDGRIINVDGQIVYIQDDQEKLEQVLESIALQGFKENERQILIDKRLINNQVKAVCKAWGSNDRQQRSGLRELLKQSGFLRTTDDNTKSEFLHLTFQEYFAGRALAHQFLSEKEADSKQASAFLATNQYKSENQVMLSFMAGEVYKQKGIEGLKKLLASLNAAPQEALGLQHLLLQLRCVEQCLGLGMPKKELETIEKEYGLRKALRAWVAEGMAEIRNKTKNIIFHGNVSAEYCVIQTLLVQSLANMPHWVKASSLWQIYERALREYPSQYVRQDAARSLSQLGALAPLLKALEDDLPEHVRCVTAKALGKLGDKVGLELLLKSLKEVKYWVPSAPAKALVKLDDKNAVAPLIAIFEDDKQHPQVRANAAYVLGHLDSKQAISPLGAALQEDKDWRVRRAAAEALGELGDKVGLELLLKSLKEVKYWVPSAPAEALVKLDDKNAVAPLIAILKDDKQHPRVRANAAYVLDHLDSKQVISPLRAALMNDPSERVRSAAAETLGHLGSKEAISPLGAALKEDPSERVRLYAAQSLGELGDKVGLELLLKSLKEIKNSIPSSPAKALVKLDDKNAVAPLIAILEDDKQHPCVRANAAYVLGHLGSKEAIPLLRNVLKDNPSERVRCAAAAALGQLGTTEVIPLLRSVLKDDPSEDVRRAVAQALGQLGSKEAISPLGAALMDSHREVHSTAAAALEKLGTPLLVEAYAQQEKVREVVLPMLVNQFYTERLVIEAGGQLMLYQKVGSTPLGKIGEEGIKALQEGLRVYRKEVAQLGALRQALVPARKYDKQGYAAHSKKNYKQAVAHYEQGLQKKRDLKESIHGRPLQEEIANTYHDLLGPCYRDLQDYEKAIESFQTAYEIRKQRLGENHWQTKASRKAMVDVYDPEGHKYYNKKDYKKAVEHYEKSLKLKLGVYGSKQHEEVAKHYHNLLGPCYRKLQDYEKAIESFQTAYEIRKQSLGENHWQTKASRKAMADVYDPEGRKYYKEQDYKKALECYEKSLKLKLEVYGSEQHKEVAYCYNNLGHSYWHLKDYKQALTYFEKAYEIYKKVLGENHKDTKVSFENAQAARETLAKREAVAPSSVENAAADVKEHATLPSAAAQYGFRVQDTDKDGNCLFKAVADQLQHQLKLTYTGKIPLYQVLRHIAANHIVSNATLYQHFTTSQSLADVEKLIQEIDKEGEWAGDEALAALSRALQLTMVRVQDNSGRPGTIAVRRAAYATNGTVYLHYVNRSHYESLYPQGDTAAVETMVKEAQADIDFIPAAIPNIQQLLHDTARAIATERAGKGASERKVT